MIFNWKEKLDIFGFWPFLTFVTKLNQMLGTFLWPFSLPFSLLKSAKRSCSSEVTLKNASHEGLDIHFKNLKKVDMKFNNFHGNPKTNLLCRLNDVLLVCCKTGICRKRIIIYTWHRRRSADDWINPVWHKPETWVNSPCAK